MKPTSSLLQGGKNDMNIISTLVSPKAEYRQSLDSTVWSRLFEMLHPAGLEENEQTRIYQKFWIIWTF